MPRTEPWTIKRVLDWTSGYLERKGDFLVTRHDCRDNPVHK